MRLNNIINIIDPSSAKVSFNNISSVSQKRSVNGINDEYDENNIDFANRKYPFITEIEPNFEKIKKNRKDFFHNQSDNNLKNLLDRADNLNSSNWKQASFSEKVIHFSIKKLIGSDNKSQVQEKRRNLINIIEKLLDIQRSMNFKELYLKLIEDCSNQEKNTLTTVAASSYELNHFIPQNYKFYATKYLSSSQLFFYQNEFLAIRIFLISLYIDLHFNIDYVSNLSAGEIISLAKAMIDEKDWSYFHPHGILESFTVDDLALLIFSAIRHKEAKSNLYKDDYQINSHFQKALEINMLLKKLIKKSFSIGEQLNFLKPISYSNFAILNQSGKTFDQACQNALENFTDDYQNLLDSQNEYLKSFGYENWLNPYSNNFSKIDNQARIELKTIYSQIANILNQSQYFKIGSIEYSQACVLNLIAKWQGKVVSPTDDVKTINNQFNFHIQKYLLSSKGYPINPFYLFSLIMSGSNGVFFQIDNGNYSYKNKVLLEIFRETFILDELERNQFIKNIEKLNLHPIDLLNNLDTSNLLSIPNNIKKLIGQYQNFIRNNILLENRTIQDSINSVMKYGQTIFLSKQNLPTITFTRLIINVLKEHGVNDNEMLEKKDVDIIFQATPRSTGVKTLNISIFQEFYLKCFQYYDRNKTIIIKGKSYEIIELIANEMNKFIINLESNEIVVAHARAKIFEKKLIETESLLKEYVYKVVLNYISYDLEQKKFVSSTKQGGGEKTQSSFITLLAKHFLVSTPVIKMLVEIIAMFEEKDWIGIIKLVPIVGPTYLIANGVYHVDALETMEGTVALCVDILFFSINEEMLLATKSSMQLEEMVLKTKNTLDDGDAQFVNDLIEKDLPFSKQRTKSNDPVQLINQVLAGDNNVKWSTPDKQMVDVKWVEDLNEVLPLKLHSEVDKRYVVLDWKTGGRDFNYHFVDKVKIEPSNVERYFSRKFTGLSGGGKFKDILNYDVRGIPLKHRSALNQLKYQLNEVSQDTTRFNKHFESNVNIAFKKVAVNEDEINLFKILDENLTDIYKKSPTLRHFFNLYFHKYKKHDAYIVKFNAKGHPATNFDKRIITLPYPEKLKDLKYVSTTESLGGRVQLVEPTLQQVHLHEILHAITDYKDLVEPYKPYVDRGPIIALESRIYYESGFNVPERIAYRVDKNAEDINFNLKEESIIAAWYENYCIDKGIESNIFFDSSSINKQFIYGDRIANRESIGNYKNLINYLQEHNQLNVPSNKALRKERLNLQFSYKYENKNINFFLSDKNSVYSNLLNAYANSLSMKNSYKVWNQFKHKDFKSNFIWELKIDDEEFSLQKKQLYGLDGPNKKINFIDKPVFYLSEIGVKRVSLARQAIEIFAELIFEELKMADFVEIQKGRKAYQIFAEKILKEIGELDYRRISGENFFSDAASNWIYKPLSQLTRTMQSEERFLDKFHKNKNLKKKMNQHKNPAKRHNRLQYNPFAFLNINQNLLNLKNINASSYEEFKAKNS